VFLSFLAIEMRVVVKDIHPTNKDRASGFRYDLEAV